LEAWGGAVAPVNTVSLEVPDNSERFEEASEAATRYATTLPDGKSDTTSVQEVAGCATVATQAGVGVPGPDRKTE
jgi:hypothetical protein